jgi:hypothetical protein
LTNPTLSGHTLQTFDKYLKSPSIVEPGCNVGSLDNAIYSTPVYTASRANGVIAFALTTGVSGKNAAAPAVLWGEVHPTLSGTGKLTNLTEFQAGYVEGGNDLGTYYPATMASDDGSLWLVAQQSSPGVYANIVFAVQRSTDPLGQLEKTRALKIGVGPPNGGCGELGLYDAMSVDRVGGPAHVWMAGQYIIRSIWGTFIGRDM